MKVFILPKWNGQKLKSHQFNRKADKNPNRFSRDHIRRKKKAPLNPDISQKETFRTNSDRELGNNFTLEIDVFLPFCYFYPNTAEDLLPVTFFLTCQEWEILCTSAKSYFTSKIEKEELKFLGLISDIVESCSNGKNSFYYRLSLGKLKTLHNAAFHYWQERKSNLVFDGPLEVVLRSTQEIIQKRYYFQ